MAATRSAQAACNSLYGIVFTPFPGVYRHSEPQYFPYLRLAEAYLRLGAAEEAATALQTSARFGVAPEEERAALEARVDALLEAQRPPPEPTPTPTPIPTPAAVAAEDAPSAPDEDTAPPPAPTRAAPGPPPATALPGESWRGRSAPPTACRWDGAWICIAASGRSG
jgi:hypothetical protein